MLVVRDPMRTIKGGVYGMQKENSNLDQHHNIESLIQVLVQQGFDTTPFALVALNNDGNPHVHASGQLKGFLDEQLFAGKFQEAHILSVQQARNTSFRVNSSPSSSPERPTMAQSSRSYSLLEDELMQQEEPSSRTTSRRLLRAAQQQRGRSTLSRDLSATSISVLPPLLAPAKERAASVVENCKPIVRRKPMQSFRIDSKADVTAYLQKRLKLLQQLAGKKIAKAWIKGICPKKQARFPYQNNKRQAETGELPRIPGWWPQDGVCRFIEPDHIRREERMKLCLHLLRLRPTPEQLRTWNDDTTEYNKTHVQIGWTAFLEELAGPEIFDDLPKEAAHRVKLRHTLLGQLYAVAALEEEFENGEIDGDTLHYYTEDEEEEKKSTVPKRSRGTSISSSVAGNSRQSSVSTSCNGTKRARLDTEQTFDQQIPNFSVNAGTVQEQLDQERAMHHEVQQRPPIPQEALPVVPIIPTNGSQTSLRASQPAQIPEASLAVAPVACSESTGGMSNRKQALRARRQLEAEMFNAAFNDPPLKEESQPAMPPPQAPIQSWHHDDTDQWIDTMAPFYPGRPGPYEAQARAPSLGPQEYNFDQYMTANMVQVPPNTPMYSSAPSLQTDVCMSTYYPQALPGAMQHATPMICNDFAMATSPETYAMDLHQPASSENWHHHGLPERMETQQGVSDLFYVHPGGSWNNRS